MSFVRMRRTHSAAGLPRKKKMARKKPAWDDTLQDLTTMKATPEEIAYRKASHQSKNALAARLQRQNKQQEKAKKADLSISNAEARQMAIMKEVLFDQYQFQKAITKSDEMMNSVKDLFGDDPRRLAGFPNVTSAPNGDNNSSHLVNDHPDIHTRMEALSQSVMEGSALNDFEDSDSDEEGEAPAPISYQPKMDMARFHQFLALEEKNQSVSTISGQAQLSQLVSHGPVQSTQLPSDFGSLQNTQENIFGTPKKDANESISILRTPGSAINDTKKIKKTRKRVAPSRTPVRPTSNLNLTDLRKVLEGLQEEIADYERQTGRRTPAEKNRQESFSGYTLSLVDSVTKLSRYLKENDIRLQAEATIREQLTQDVAQMASLIDALTSDIILTQEEHNKLQRDFDRYKVDTHTEIAQLKAVLCKAGLMEKEEDSPPSSSRPVPDFRQVTEQMSAVPDHLKNTSSAILLSPPVRKTRLQQQQQQQQQELAPQQTERQTSLIDVATMGTSHNSGGFVTQLPPRSQQSVASSQESTGQVPSEMHTGQLPPSQHASRAEQNIMNNYPNIPGVVPLTAADKKNFNDLPVSVQQSQSFPVQHNGMLYPMQTLSQSAVQGGGQGQHTSHPGQGSQSTAARVTVPRPSPLVQSNVPMMNAVRPPGQFSTLPQNHIDPSQRGQGVGMAREIPGSQNIQHGSYPISQNQSIPRQQYTQGSNSNAVPHTGPINTKDLLAAQIAELNKQHEEAQVRLQSLMQQQKQTQEEHKNHQATIAKAEEELQQTKSSQQPGLPSHPVSPPISPISQRSENFLSLQGLAMRGQNAGLPSSRGITVSIPSASLDTSTDLESSPSPRRA